MISSIKDSVPAKAFLYTFSTKAIVDFHGKFVTTFEALPSDHKVKEIAKRVLVVAVAAFAYPILAATALISLLAKAICQITGLTPSEKIVKPPVTPVVPSTDPAKKDATVKPVIPPVKPSTDPVKEEETDKVPPKLPPKLPPIEPKKHDSKIEKPEDPILDSEEMDFDIPPEKQIFEETDNIKAMRLIRSNRLEDMTKELDRLRKSEILTPDAEKKMDKALNKVSVDSKQILQMKCELARALEIKKLYQDDYYVFTHAQETNWMTMTYLIKELVKVYHPEKDIRLFKYMRTPEVGAKDTENLAETKGSKIDDHVLRKDLLSVSPYFYDTSSNESAISFLSQNRSVFDAVEGFNTVTESIIKEFLPKTLPPKELEALLSDISNKLSKLNMTLSKPKAGNLFVICVPKILVDEMGSIIAYRSHSMGVPCKCHFDDKDTNKGILQSVQLDILEKDTTCGGTPPQYRLMAKELTPDSGVKSFLLTPKTKKERHEIKDGVRKIVKEIAQKTYSAFQTEKKSDPIFLYLSGKK